MSHPRSESEYLARLIPPSVTATGLNRRRFLRGALGLGAAVGFPTLLTACGGGSGGGGGESGEVTLGSNASDEAPRAVVEALVTAFQESAGTTVDTNTVDHNTFQENINNYLQGNPDDVFTWFAGFRMRFFAERGLAGDISDVWQDLSGYNDAFREASTGNDGNQYFVPQSYYPWAVFYRKSVFQERGYRPPETLDDLTALAQQMQTDGLIPIAFGDADGWPAMGTFDVLNMRINGYDYHVNLMAGEESWESPEVRTVFETWRELLPYHQPDALGRTWQEAAQSLQRRESGMYLLGLFVGEQFAGEEDDLDFFNFPQVDSNIGASAIDAPIDGFMMSAEPSNEEGAKAFLTFLGSPEAGNIMTETQPTTIAANSESDTSGYSELQNRAVELVGSAESIAQFMDRDTRPDFASTVMIPALQEFIGNPDDLDTLLSNIESQKQSIFSS